MKITFLGTGTSLGIPIINCPCPSCNSQDKKDKRLRCSIKIETKAYTLLVDASTDLRQQALKFGLKKIDGIFLTHSHADHILGLDETRLFSLVHKKPIELFGSKETLHGVKKLFWYAFLEDKDKRMLKPYFKLNILEKTKVLFDMNVTPIFANHFEMTVTGFRFNDFTYLTDFKNISKKEKNKIKGTKLFILGALRYSDSLSHLTIKEAVSFAKEINADKTYLTHFSHEIMHSKLDSELPENIFPAYDGLTLTY
jgi:phosphoribosyl 1,2-cyclic phosphate phosphodiesterase